MRSFFCRHPVCRWHPVCCKLSFDGFGLSIYLAIATIRACWRSRLACQISRCKLPVLCFQLIHNITYSLQ